MSSAPLFGPAWKKFERIVAAIYKYKDVNADVRWNEKIDGRQLDVTVRFQRLGFKFLLVIECRNLTRAVKVGEVEAFVTKSKDLGADRAIMVTTIGYQRAAKKSAKRHGITLYTLTEVETLFPPQEVVINEPALNVLSVNLWPVDQVSPVPIATPQGLLGLRFFSRQPGGRVVTLSQIIEEKYPKEHFATATARRAYAANFKTPTVARLVTGEELEVRRIEFTVERGTKPTIATIMPPNLPFSSFILQDATGKRETIGGSDLPIGLDNAFVVGKFYRNIVGLTYRCEKVEGDKVYLLAFLGNQHGGTREFSARIRGPVSDAPFYVELIDEAEIAEFEAKYREHPAFED